METHMESPFPLGPIVLGQHSIVWLQDKHCFLLLYSDNTDCHLLSKLFLTSPAPHSRPYKLLPVLGYKVRALSYKVITNYVLIPASSLDDKFQNTIPSITVAQTVALNPGISISVELN